MDDPISRAVRGASIAADMERQLARYDEIAKAAAGLSRATEIMTQAGVMDRVATLGMKAAAMGDIAAQFEKHAAMTRLIGAHDPFAQLRKIEMIGADKLFDFTRSASYLAAVGAMQTPDIFGEMARRVEAAQLIIPRVDALTRLAQETADRAAAWESVIAKAKWADDLTARMASIPTAWALPDAVGASVEAFARLSTLGDVVRSAPVYTDETTEVLIENLGEFSPTPEAPETIEGREARFDDAGRDRSLIAFSPGGYGAVLGAAGYAVAFPPPPLVVAEGGSNEPVAFNPQVAAVLQSVEAHLRQWVTARMVAAFGQAWVKQKVAPDLKNRWVERRAAQEAAGKPIFALIYYADFMDLYEIVRRKDHWPLFPEFVSLDNFQVSLLRLYGVRNDVAHTRPIALTDELVVMTEASVLFRAMGMGLGYLN